MVCFSLIWDGCLCMPFWMQDHEMHRGKPLYLSQERYAALTYLVTVPLSSIFILYHRGMYVADGITCSLLMR
jgi:hypothetical protein